MIAYYNEIDPFAAQWLRNLISAGHIAPGDVDERSIVDVRPADLAGYTQCHFFAGIGGWSLALRLAGWPDDRPVWTGSCPCQDFSAAGKGAGFSGERHLWPYWFPLIRECRPRVVFGEQVASPLALSWLDLVHDDMEGADYAFAAFDLCAAGVGAPHIRQRLGFVADADDEGLSQRERNGRIQSEAMGAQPWKAPVGSSGARGMADAAEPGRDEQPLGPDRTDGRTASEPRRLRDARGMGVPDRAGPPPGREAAASDRYGHPPVATGGGVAAGTLHVDWRDADWLLCRDGKWRPVEPGTQPLAHGIPGRVGRLRAYGNAIVPALWAELIGAYLDLTQARAA